MEMLLQRIGRFLRKSPDQKRVTIRFFATVGFSKLPYAPHRVRLSISPAETISFWWSYIAPSAQPERKMSEYWGDDIGELRFLWRILRPGMTFLDVGAYHGIYSVLAAMRLGSTGQIVAFEPSDRERRRLKLHLRLNHLPTVGVEPYAVSSQNADLTFYKIASGPTSMNSLRRPHAQATVQEIPIQSIRLDDYPSHRGIGMIDLLKVDTEGGELAVFAGAQDILKRQRPLIICEVLDWVTEPWGYRAREIVARLREHDYEWFDFRQDGTLFPHQSKNDYPDVKNYLAVPREKIAAVREWILP